MDSSESPVHIEQEGSTYNSYFGLSMGKEILAWINYMK